MRGWTIYPIRKCVTLKLKYYTNVLYYILQENVDVWLKEIGLQKYKKAFTKCHIKATKDMEQLKSFGVDDIKNELGIKKPGALFLVRVGRF